MPPPSLGLRATILALAFVFIGSSAPGEPNIPRLEFDANPNWVGYRNRLLPQKPRITRQNFGYRGTAHAGGRRPGEIGGFISRSSTPATYAKVIASKSLNEKLRASGGLAMPHDEGGSTACFGWFYHTSRGWRTLNSLFIRVDGIRGRETWSWRPESNW